MNISPFKTELESRVKLDDVPNARFDTSKGQFSFGDYVWKNPEEQLYPSDRDPADIAEEDMYTPYRDVCQRPHPTSLTGPTPCSLVEEGDSTSNRLKALTTLRSKRPNLAMRTGLM